MQMIICTPGDKELCRYDTDFIPIPHRMDIIHLTLPGHATVLKFRVEEVEWFIISSNDSGDKKGKAFLGEKGSVNTATAVVVLTVRSNAPATVAYIKQIAATKPV